ncbi:MAG: YitT family protein [Bacilli bacterium]|nr:YitT family protein [Bacilli bacterium]
MVNFLKEYFTKNNFKKIGKDICVLIFSSILLSIGSGFFLVPFSINVGGISGITILLSEYLAPDITYYIFYWSLFVIGIIFLGPRFSLSTLLVTILEPVFMTLILRTGLQKVFLDLVLNNATYELSNGVIQNLGALDVSTGLILAFALLGGLVQGVGCALTFRVGASTGGVDVITFIISKYTGVKETVPYFAIDATIVATGIIVSIIKSSNILLISSLFGILGAFVSSIAVEQFYSARVDSYGVDIITSKPDEICDFAIKSLDRSATLVKVVGAYSGEEKTMIRILFSKREYERIRNEIARIDPNAFCSFFRTLFVGGEGFGRLQAQNESVIKLVKRAHEKNQNKDGK